MTPDRPSNNNFDNKNDPPQNDTERLTRTLIGSINSVAPKWLSKYRDTTEDIVSLGAGLGLEQKALIEMFPNAKRTGVDKNPDGVPFHKANKAEFLAKEITDPEIYDKKTVRLAIFRNPGPATGPEGVWKDGFKLAWENLETDGIFYATTDKTQLESIRKTLEAAGIANYETFENEHLLTRAGFQDQIVIVAHKNSTDA